MLEISRLSKQFGPLVAVDDVSFTVPAGEVLGFLAPTSGTAVICGHDILREPLRAKRRIGYLPEGAPAYPDMSAAEFLDFIAHIRGFRGAEAKQRIAHIAELINIAEIMDQPIETLSKGYRRRVGVAQALLHDPDVVILDEPTDGLDPNQKHEMRGIIQRMSPEKAIIISTHLLEEVEAVCSRAIIIARGRVLADGTPAELAARSRHHNAVRIGLPPAGSQPTIAAELGGLPGVGSIERASDAEGDGLWLFPRDRRPIVAEVAGLIRARGWTVTGIRAERGRLDDVFRAITTAPPATPDPAREAA